MYTKNTSCTEKKKKHWPLRTHPTPSCSPHNAFARVALLRRASVSSNGSRKRGRRGRGKKQKGAKISRRALSLRTAAYQPAVCIPRRDRPRAFSNSNEPRNAVHTLLKIQRWAARKIRLSERCCAACAGSTETRLAAATHIATASEQQAKERESTETREEKNRRSPQKPPRTTNRACCQPGPTNQTTPSHTGHPSTRTPPQRWSHRPGRRDPAKYSKKCAHELGRCVFSKRRRAKTRHTPREGGVGGNAQAKRQEGAGEVFNPTPRASLPEKRDGPRGALRRSTRPAAPTARSSCLDRARPPASRLLLFPLPPLLFSPLRLVRHTARCAVRLAPPAHRSHRTAGIKLTTAPHPPAPLPTNPSRAHPQFPSQAESCTSVARQIAAPAQGWAGGLAERDGAKKRASATAIFLHFQASSRHLPRCAVPHPSNIPIPRCLPPPSSYPRSAAEHLAAPGAGSAGCVVPPMPVPPSFSRNPLDRSPCPLPRAACRSLGGSSWVEVQGDEDSSISKNQQASAPSPPNATPGYQHPHQRKNQHQRQNRVARGAVRCGAVGRGKENNSRGRIKHKIA